MSHQKLWEIAEKLDLYPQERAAGKRQEVIKRLSDNIYVEMVDIKTSQAGSTRQGIATVAFTVAFEDPSPEIARVVAAELAELYMSENRKQRGKQAAEVSSFLEEEAERLAAEMAESERKLAEFKKKHLGATPELSKLNLRLMEQTENKIQRLEDRIRALEERRMSLEAQLAITSPYKDVYTEKGARVQSPGERLSSLTAEYLRLSATYAQDHPDVVKLRQRYSEEHPDVKKLQQSVASLERELRNISIDRGTSTIMAPLKPDNPTYIALQTQLNSVMADIAADQSTKKKYQEIKDKLLEARMAEQLEMGGKAERFTMVAEPYVPSIPEKPNRLGIVLLGGVLAFASGLVGVAFKEYTDHTVRGSKGVLAISHAPPLVCIPYISNSEDVQRERVRRNRSIMIWGTVVLLAIASFVLLFVTKQQ